MAWCHGRISWIVFIKGRNSRTPFNDFRTRKSILKWQGKDAEIGRSNRNIGSMDIVTNQVQADGQSSQLDSQTVVVSGGPGLNEKSEQLKKKIFKGENTYKFQKKSHQILLICHYWTKSMIRYIYRPQSFCYDDIMERT